MPFCFNCGKEIQSEWVTCPFCSANLPEIQTESSEDENVWEEALDSHNGKPTDDWSSVFHNGELIELVSSEDGYYYWADEEWHELNLEEEDIAESEDEVPSKQEAEESTSPPPFDPPSPRSSPPPFNPPRSRASPPPFNPPRSRASPPPFNPPRVSSKTTRWKKLPLFWKIWMFAILTAVALILLDTQLGLVDEGFFMGIMIIGCSVLVMLLYLLIKSSNKHSRKKKEEALARGEEVKQSKASKIVTHIITAILGIGVTAAMTNKIRECRQVQTIRPTSFGGLDIPAQYETVCTQVHDPNIEVAILLFILILLVEAVIPFLNWIRKK